MTRVTKLEGVFFSRSTGVIKFNLRVSMYIYTKTNLCSDDEKKVKGLQMRILLQ